MNLNNTCDYIDATNSYPIIDYIDEQIENNNIYITSNTYSSNVSLNNNEKLNNSLYYSSSNLIINNNNNFGEIRFKTAYNYPIDSNKIGTIIDFSGKLLVYHNYNILQPMFGAGYYDVEGEILALKADGISTDGQLTLLEAAVVGIEEQIISLTQAGNLTEGRLNSLINNIDVALNNEQLTNLNNAITYGQAAQQYADIVLNLRVYANNIYYRSVLTGIGVSVGLGLAGAAIAAGSSYIYYQQASNALFINSNISSNDKYVIYSNNTSNEVISYSNYNYSTSNLAIFNGFINSNIITTQYINSINTNEIKMNNLNFSNIFVTSNVLNTTSNILSNYTFNSSNLNFNYTFDSSNILNNKINNNSNVITYNNSNLLFNTNYTVERPYPPKLYNSSTSQSVVTYLNQNPTYYETFTLTTADITYGSGTYEVRSSSIDDTTISFTGNTSNNTDYTYIYFKNNGTLTLNSSILCDILIVGGGGQGGCTDAGGGGAGGLVFMPNLLLNNDTYNVIVGTGGVDTGGTADYTTGSSGNDTIIRKSDNSIVLIAKGGGGGGTRFPPGSAAAAGGSGGGAGSGTSGSATGGSATQTNSSIVSGNSLTYGFGNSGGNNANNGKGGAGGGGAGAAGANNNATGQGGNGRASVVIDGITYNFKDIFNLTTNTGSANFVGKVEGDGNIYFAGGGGGGHNTITRIGGLGGGGSGVESGNGGAATLTNTGSGGGGGGGGFGQGGRGSDGVVIIRFLTPTITTKKELFNLITNDSGCTFKTNQYDITNGNYLTTNRYINNYYGDWVIIKKPNPIYLIKYQIYNRSSFIERGPSLFKIFGSTDGITYDEITEASNTTPLTTSNYSSGYFEKIVNYNSKAYSYFALVVNKIVGGNINAHMLNFTEFKIFGKEFINYTPIYTSSNVVKTIVEFDMPRLKKKSAFYCTTTNVIYPNGGDTPYYAYHIDLRNYTQTGYIDIGSGSGDPYRILKIQCFFGSSYFQRLINGIPDIVDYTIYMSYKANSAGGDTKQGLNIMATGIPQSYYLDTIPPNRIFLLRNISNDFNYISVVTTSSSDVRVFIEDMLN